MTYDVCVCVPYLHVTIYDTLAVEVGEGQGEFGRVKPRSGLAELAYAAEVEEELSSAAVVQDEVPGVFEEKNQP